MWHTFNIQSCRQANKERFKVLSIVSTMGGIVPGDKVTGMLQPGSQGFWLLPFRGSVGLIGSFL